MTTLIVQNAIQVTIQAAHSTRTIDNVLGFEVAPGFTSLDMPTLLSAVKTAWEAVGGPWKLHNSGTTMVRYRAVDLRSSSGSTAELASTAAGGLAVTGSTMASCALVQFGSSSRSRAAQGRLYHGPLCTTQVQADGRSVVAGTVTSLKSAYEQFDAATTAAGYQWSVISRKDSLLHPISGILVSPLVATQRRRMRS